MPEHYSPLRYPGGKAKLANFLLELLKCNGLKQPHYVEPYAGGAGAALRLLFEEYVTDIVINDADPRIRCFWQSVTKQNDAFLALLRGVKVTVAEWHRQRAIYERRDLRKVLDLGFATFFLNRTTRSGIVHNAGPIGGYDQRGKYKIDARFNREQLCRRIQRIGGYADRIDVSGHDGLALLKRINAGGKRAAHTFVYIDPPYYEKGADLYLNRFVHEEHAELAAYLHSSKRFQWIMTYDNVAPIRKLYRNVPRLFFSLSYSAYERRRGEEILIHPSSLIVPARAKASLPSVA